jgi:UDP-glucuronate decarboxylase
MRPDLALLTRQLDQEEFRSKRVLVTGGAGFIGSWLCDVLVSMNAVIYCVDDLSTGLADNTDHLLEKNTFLLRKLDVIDFEPRKRRYDFVLHFASRAAPEEYQQHPVETLMVNSLGTRNMLEVARKNDARLVYASSSEVYGDAQLIPTPETYVGKVNPIGPRSCYDEGKRFGEALCTAYHGAYGLDARIVRIFNTYGPRLRSDGLYARALSRFVVQALLGRDLTVYGKGDQTRSFCYITDTVAAISRLMTQSKMKGVVINIGNPQEVTILELAEKVRAIANSGSKITFHSRPVDDPQRRCPDISKARELLNWSPRINLEDGLRKTIAWFRQRALASKS